jgi:hypothetical protein
VTDVLVVGVVAGDERVVVVVVAVVTKVLADFAVVDEPAVTAEVAAVARLWWGSAARTANSPTPASDPAATQLVVVRLRRNQVSLAEGVVMPLLRPTRFRAT